MKRLTIDKPNGMYELAHNGCYIDENGYAIYRDFETDIEIRELTRDIMRSFGLWEIDDNEMLSDDVFDDTIMENLMYGTKELEGLIALFYRNLWAMAELRERLKHYEDLEEKGLLQELPCKIGADVYSIPSKVNFDLNVLSGHKENNRVYHQKITNIVFTENGWYMTGHLDMEYGTGRIFLDKFYKETWFLTKEEAEAKLKELENE